MKSLFYGIAVATLAGLSVGGVLRPTLAGDRVGGPQIALADSGRRAYGDGEYQTAANSYPYGLPDYVVGTDNLQQADFASSEVVPASYQTAWNEPAPYPVQTVSYQAPPLPTYESITHRYPSQGGGILAGISDEAPADLGPEVFEPADAPPAAMAAYQRDQAANPAPAAPPT